MMRNFIAILASIIIIQGIQAQDTYYWYSGIQKGLRTIQNRKFILVSNALDTIGVKTQVINNGYSIEYFKESKVNTIIPFKSNTLSTEYWTIIEINNSPIVLSDSNIIYSAPFFITQDSTLVGLSHLFYVKLNSSNDINILENMALINNVKILGNNQYMPLWYTLSCMKESLGNALQMANIFYESGLFAAAEPDILVDDLPTCVNDTYFENQWALNNTGQNGGTSGIDINFCKAQEITSGSPNIIVAVIDQGVELNHPDLTNMYPISYNTETHSSPSTVYDYHGTACAGIIGANSDNNLGIAGIAPISPIMSISNMFLRSVDSRMKRANGINFAWKNGASVISNSWSTSEESQTIDEAVNRATNEGRNNKGCVVVFSSGNDNKYGVEYPSNLSKVIAVGAVDKCGIRSGRTDIIPRSCDPWGQNSDPGSSYGSGLYVVAPGTNVYTTDWHGKYRYFGGTSAACPHVAGVAALMLSVNPEMTQQQVKYIISATAQKLSNYTFYSFDFASYGTWNNQVGYGLVDAYAAVKASQCYNSEPILENVIKTDRTINENTFGVGDITIRNGKTLTVNSTLSMAPDAKIIVEPGAKLIVNGGTITSACLDEFWGAIFVMGDRNQPQTQQYQGYVELNNATIENARNAISTWYPENWNTTGGIIKATNTTFKNNIRSVEYLSYNNSNQNQGIFTNCTFSWDDKLFAHDKSQLSHVTMYDVKGVKFTKCYFSKNYENEVGNTILTHGILSENAGFYVTGRTQNANNPVEKSEFNNLDYGIRASNLSGKIFEVSNSIFNYNSCGVFASIANNFKVTESNFNLRPAFNPIVNPDVDYIKMIAVGISSDRSSGYKIENNNFNGISFERQSNHPANTVGIGIQNSGENANLISNNTFTNLYGGSQALGTNRKNNDDGPKIGLKYSCNTFSNSLYGLYVTKHNANTDIYGICEEQGSLSVPALNFFNNNITDICNSNCPKIYYSFSSNISNTQPTICNDKVQLINIETQDNTCGNICVTKTKDQWYYDRDILSEQYALLLFNYNNLLDGGQKDELLDKLQEGWDGDVWAVRDEYLAKSPYLSEEVLREMVQGEKLPLAICTEILLSNPEATQTDKFKEFMYKEENYLSPLSRSLIEESWEEKTFRANMESNISAKFTELEMTSRALIGIILNDSLGINLEEYRNVLSEMKSPETRFELTDSYIDEQEYSNARESLSILQGNENYIEPIERYLQYIDLVEEAGSPYNLSKETLLSLEETNDAIGAKAKSILYFKGIKTDYHPIVVNMENEPKSKPVRIQSSLSDLSNADITVVPNPAKDHITITYNLPPKQIYTLKIYDNKGIELLNKTLNSNKGMKTIELKTLKSGTYYYTITDSKSVVKSDKIIIVN
ncbi:MAG: subtilisin-like serine protease [Bacteroidetes bacterium]|nr:subtilisin-like serine protease [Bacteroidota bacterium]